MADERRRTALSGPARRRTRRPKRNPLVCVLAGAEGFSIIELEKSEKAGPQQSRYDGEPGLWVYLTLVPPGKITSPLEQNHL
jgi:hypothetical protein